MELKDVNDDWILENFDIDIERKIKTEVSKIYNYSLEELFDEDDKISVPDFIKKLETIVKEAEEKFIATRTDVKVFRTYIEHEHNTYYGDCDSSAYVVFEYDKTETDKEVITRIKKKKKAEITRDKKAKSKKEKDLIKLEKLKKEISDLEEKYK